MIEKFKFNHKDYKKLIITLKNIFKDINLDFIIKSNKLKVITKYGYKSFIFINENKGLTFIIPLFDFYNRYNLDRNYK